MAAVTRPQIRFIVALVTMGIALAAQQLIAADAYDLRAWALMLCAAIGFASATRGVDEPAPPETTSGVAVEAVTQRIIAASLGGIALVAAIGFSETDLYPFTSLALWLVALAAASWSLAGWRACPGRTGAPLWDQREVVILLLIVLLAALARFPWLSTIPYYVIGDESRVAAQIARYPQPRGELRSFFHMGWNTWPNMGIALQGILTPLFGIHTTTLRMSSALVGTLAVASTYVLARELFSRRVAVLTAVLFAICRTAIDFSRLGVCHAQVILWGSLAMALWFRALNSGKALTFLWSGIALGLCVYSYNAGQSFPPLLFSWIVISAVLRPSAIRTQAKGAALVVAGFVLCVAPLVYHITDHLTFLHNWVEWTHMARNRQVIEQIMGVWNQQGWDEAKPLVVRQVLNTALGFTAIPAGAYSVGYRGGGMLDHVTAPLFLLGMAMLVARPWRRQSVLLYWFFANAFIGSVLTDDPPATVRMVGLIPTMPLMAALPLSALIALSPGAAYLRRTVMAFVVVLFIGAGYDTWRTYFIDFAATEPDGATDLARYIRKLPKDYSARLLGAEYYLRFEEEFFDIDFAGRDLRNVDDPAQFLPIHYPLQGPLAVVLSPIQLGLTPYLKELYPGATTVERVASNDKSISFRMTTISLADIQARSGLTARVAGMLTGVGDPFDSGNKLYARLDWTGQVYWPTHLKTKIRLRSKREAEITIGSSHWTARAGEVSEGEVELPMGWVPITIAEVAGEDRALAISVEVNGAELHLNRWALRPDATREGLLAVYSRNGAPLLRRIDPQINSHTLESIYEAPRHELLLRSPFSVDWTAQLTLPSTGKYIFQVNASGPYQVEIDGKPLCAETVVVPEDPKKCIVERELSQGSVSLKAHWDSISTQNSNRRILQLLWTPPDGEREIIPPTRFAPPPLS